MASKGEGEEVLCEAYQEYFRTNDRGWDTMEVLLKSYRVDNPRRQSVVYSHRNVSYTSSCWYTEDNYGPWLNVEIASDGFGFDGAPTELTRMSRNGDGRWVCLPVSVERRYLPIFKSLNDEYPGYYKWLIYYNEHLQEIHLNFLSTDFTVGPNIQILFQKGVRGEPNHTHNNARVYTDYFSPTIESTRDRHVDWTVDRGGAVKSHAEVKEGGFLSCGVYRAVVQGDGNFVCYDGESAYWSTNTDGKGKAPYRLAVQSDGNVVLYDGVMEAIWFTGTVRRGTGPYRLALQSDRNLVLYDSKNVAFWITGKST